MQLAEDSDRSYRRRWRSWLKGFSGSSAGVITSCFNPAYDPLVIAAPEMQELRRKEMYVVGRDERSL